MPTPVSLTVIVAAPVASGRTATETLPPFGVNFSALPTRFATA